MTLSRITLALTAVLAAAVSFSQPATPAQRAGVPANPGFGTMHYQTKVGSFKMLDAQGRVEIDFTGTLLLSRYEGLPAAVSGDIRVEYDNKDRQKVVYFGSGRIVLNGKWRGAQIFGRNLRAVWFGAGVVRLSGEFDRNLETGWYWYDDPADRGPWPSQGVADFHLPPFRLATPAKPRARDEVKKP